MNKSIQKYAGEWEQNAEADALWIILTDKRYYRNKWDKEEFFATGEEEISRVFNFMGEHQIEVPKGLFVDFGCGVGRLSRALRTRFSA
ncbi:MAG: class I SAM-dependent methyltransferase, partial [Smithella sp.]